MHHRYAVSTAAVVMLIVAACAGDDVETVVVSGYVHAGPTCPVVQDPPDPACDDRPVPDAVIEFLDSSGRVADRITTGADGRFSLHLQPGAYTMAPQPVEGLLGTAPSETFAIGTAPVVLDIAYDTGIR